MKIKLNIWDTIGQEKYRSLSNLFLKDTKIVILVYSIISRESFDNLNYWLNLYKDHLDKDTILGVAANKNDLYLKQEISEEEGIKYAEENKAIFGLISAKLNKNSIDKFINKLVDAYLTKNKNIIENNSDNKTVKLNKNKIAKNINQNNSKGSCCGGGNNKVRKKRYDSIVKYLDGRINSVFLGDKGVGKTSIINRIKGNKVNINEKHTEINIKYSIDYNNKEMSLNLIIYDVNIELLKTKEFLEIIKNSKIFFVVYDVKNKQSVNNLEYWVEVIKRCKDYVKNPNYLLYIIGNKDDSFKEDNEKENKEESNDIMENNEKKKYIDEGKEFSISQEAIFKVVSAKEDRGINNIITESIEHYLCLK